MRSQHILLMIVSLICTVAFAGCGQSSVEPAVMSTAAKNVRVKIATDMDASAVELPSLSAGDHVRDAFRRLTNDALTSGGLSNLAKRLAGADPERMRSYVDNKDNLLDLNEVVMRIRRDWKNKYGNDFKLGNADKIFSDVNISSMTTGNGVNQAVATLPEDGNLPAAKLNLARESDAWKIDLPDSVTGEILKASLIRHLDMVDHLKDRWPADQNQTYRLVARHVLRGISEAGRK